MGSVALVFRSELRRRWASWIALAALVAVIGGTALSGFSAEQRTNAAFPSFVQRYGFNAEIGDFKGIPREIGTAKYVRTAAIGKAYLNGNVVIGGHFIPESYVNVYALPSSHLDSSVKLLSGRWPSTANDVLVGFSMQQQYGLHVGSLIDVPFYRPNQRGAVLNGNVAPPTRGPTIRFHVVGVEASLVDFPSANPTFTIFTDTAFTRGEGRGVAFVGYAFVRLDRGALDMPKFQVMENNRDLGALIYVQDVDTATASIEASIRPQAIGWLLFGLFAALAGVALIAQALARQSVVERESYPTLAALGMRPQQLFELGMLRSVAVGSVGAVGAVLLAFVFSPLTPVGEAGVAAASRGFVFDTEIFVLGALALVVVVGTLAVMPSWRSSQVGDTRARDNRDAAYRTSTVATAVGRSGAPPSVLIGVRNALERGRGRSRVPAATALVGVIFAVAALTATSVFGASLSTLVATPRLYGSNWQVDLQNLPTRQLGPLLSSLKHDATVTRVTYGGEGKFIDVNGAPVESVYVAVAKGPMVFSLIDGHYPRGSDEIDLGTTSLAAAHAKVGSTVRIGVINQRGRTYTRAFVVAGSVAISPSFDIGGPGVGDVVLLSGLESVACNSSNPANPCIEAINAKLRKGNSWNVEIGVVGGAAGQRTVHRLDGEYAPSLVVDTLPTNLVNFGQAVDFPLLLGGTMALFGVAMLSHLLLVSVSRRRRQFAILKVLGMRRRQVASTLCWQSLTVAVVGVAFGVPLGVAFGRFIWHAFSIKLGVVPVEVVAVSSLVVLAVAIVAAGVILSLVPAALATHVRPAHALREPT